MVAAIVSAVFDSNGSLRKPLPSDCHTSGVDRHRNSLARVFDRKGNLWRSYRADSLNDHGLLPLLRHARYALQETSMITSFVALSVWLLLRASRLGRGRDWFLGGLALGAIALTRASTAPFIPLALVWTIWTGVPADFKQRLGKAVILGTALLLTVGPWLIRTWRVSGAPVLSS